ncbi:MAG: glycosyltransferase family 39 protein [bacterium]|nr:glycosyltransferase family 39 protein [bacterium]
MVYDSYSILKTGKDQTGEAYPLTFKMGAGRPAGYVYFSIPFVATFGPSVWGVRGLSIFSGLGIIILMFFFGKKLFNEKVGLVASFLTSISLWDLYLSRAGFEAHFALFLALLGVVLFVYKKYIPMAVFWGLAIFSYPTFKLTIPLLFLILLLLNGFKKVFKNKIFLISILILASFAGFALNETFKGVSEQRFLSINVFSDTNLKESIIQKINEQRNLSTFPEVLKPLIYNKPLKYSRILFENYLDNLSPHFLYLRGDGNPRHNPGETGMFYLVELPLLFVGLYFLAKGEKKKLCLLVLWILIVPLATMLTGEPHGLRNNFIIPPFVLISSFALTKISKKLSIIAFTLIGIQLIFVLMTVYFYAPNKFGSFWSARARDVVLEVINQKDKYETIVLSTNIDNVEYAYITYTKVDPNEVIFQYGKLPKKYDNVIITDKVSQYINTENILILEE